MKTIKLYDTEFKVGDNVRLHFAGGPSDMPLPWTLIRIESKYSTVNYEYNPSFTVRAMNGVVCTFDFVDMYSPEVVS